LTRELITGIIYSQFDEKMGPVAVRWFPDDISMELRNLISLKTINIMIGEDNPGTKSLAVLPFPSIGLKGLVKFLEIKDVDRRGGVIESSLTLLYREEHDSIFYKYLSNFEVLFDEVIDEIIELEEKNGDKKKIEEILTILYSDVTRTLEELKSHEISTEEEGAFPEAEKEGEVTKYRFKLIVVGDPMVGKTSLVLRFTDKAFRRTYISTIGVNITEKNIKHKKAKIELIIWDIAGQAKFQRMRKHFYKGADAILLVYDLSRGNTIKSIPKWNMDIETYLNTKIPGFIVANKGDLVEERAIKEEDGKRIANELGYGYLETSALDGTNVDEAFLDLAQKLFELEKKRFASS
jgi:small GTP-binding protein